MLIRRKTKQIVALEWQVNGSSRDQPECEELRSTTDGLDVASLGATDHLQIVHLLHT